MKEISVNDIRQIRIGQMEDAENGTGCTVFVCEEGMRAGLDVRGGGPASRESELLKPLAAAQYIHSIVLAGGSAFGLGTANGVMKCLEERNIGFDVGVTKVPLVVQSDLFDLTVGSAFRRPDPEMGYAAAVHALDDPNYRDGNYGAGCGATVGKITGMDNCMKTGIGSYAVQIGDLQIGAVVALNALGDVYDWKTGGRREPLCRKHDPRRGHHQCGIPETGALQDRGDGPRRLCAFHPAGAHLGRRRQHLCGVCRKCPGRPGRGRRPGGRGRKRGNNKGRE